MLVRNMEFKTKGTSECAYASAFFGVDFLGVAFFAAVFFGAAFFAAFGAAGALVLVTRPDFVLPNTRDTSSDTAGAGAAFLGLLALALGLAAAFFAGAFSFAAAVFLVAVAFFGPGFAAAVFCDDISIETCKTKWQHEP